MPNQLYQSSQARGMANDQRVAQSQFIKEMKSGDSQAMAVQALSDPEIRHKPYGSLRIHRLLHGVKGWGPKRIRQVLVRNGIYALAEVETLTPRQKGVLIDEILKPPAPHGRSRPEWRPAYEDVLRAIGSVELPTSASLVRKEVPYIDPYAIAGALHALKGQGFISRPPNAKDGSRAWSLTEKGQKKCSELA